MPCWSSSPDLSSCLVTLEADVEELWNSSDRSEGQQNKTKQNACGLRPGADEKQARIQTSCMS